MRAFMLARVAAIWVAGIGSAYAGSEAYQYGPAYINASTAMQGIPAGEGLPGAGANGLYTRVQARNRIEGAGYTDVTGLTRSSHANWRGQAMRSGILNQVNVDSAGDVTSKL
jgi:hypothetical protein